MFYGGNNTSGDFFLFSQEIGLASSSDGIAFTRLKTTPVIENRMSESWNTLGSNYPASILYKDTLRVYYSGVQDSMFNFRPGIGYSYLDSSLLNLYDLSFDSPDVFVYPNPSNSTVFLESKEEVSIQEVNVYELNGKKVRSEKVMQNQFSLHVNNLPKGMYLIEIRLSNGVVKNKKIIRN